MTRIVMAALACLLAASAVAQTSPQCYSNAKTQTGYDPNATTTAANTQDNKSDDKPVAKGAVRGAVVSGATGGDPAAGPQGGGGGLRRGRS